MQDKKIIALIVLAVLAVVSLIYGVTANPKSRAHVPAAAGGQIAVVSTQAQVPANNAIATTRRAKRSQFTTWKRSPFADGRSSVTSTELVLNGIIWNKTKPKAMIGDVMVAKGETVGGNKVIDIQPKKVVLNDGTKNFELTIEK